MMEFGETFRRAREATGLTTSDIAKMTHMLEQQVQALEREDFSKIAAPIYGRGFVRLYCEALGIDDPKPFVDEFMEIYSGNRPPTIRMRTPVQVVQEIPQQTELPEDVPENETVPPADATEPQGGSEESLSAPAQMQDKTAEHHTENASENFSTSGDDLFSYNPDENAPIASEHASPHKPTRYAKNPSRYSTPQPMDFDEEVGFTVPPIVWRIAIFTLAVALLAFLLFTGLRAVYKFSMTSSQQKNLPAQSAQQVNPSEPEQRTPMKIPALYID